MMLYEHKPWEDMLDQVFKNLYDTICQNNYDTYEYGSYRLIFGRFLYQLNKDKITAFCENEDTCTNVDVEGNLYDCNSSHIPVGHMSTGPIKLINHNIKTELCQQCSVLRFCGGGCNKSPANKLKYFCYTQKNEYIRMIELLNKFIEFQNKGGKINGGSNI